MLHGDSACYWAMLRPNEQNRVIKASFVTGDPSFLLVPTLCQHWFLLLCTAQSFFQHEGFWPQPDGHTSGLFTEIPAVHGPDSLAECQHALGAFSNIQVTRPDFSECPALWWPLEYAFMLTAPGNSLWIVMADSQLTKQGPGNRLTARLGDSTSSQSVFSDNFKC